MNSVVVVFTLILIFAYNAFGQSNINRLIHSMDRRVGEVEQLLRSGDHGEAQARLKSLYGKLIYLDPAEYDFSELNSHSTNVAAKRMSNVIDRLRRLSSKALPKPVRSDLLRNLRASRYLNDRLVQCSEVASTQPSGEKGLAVDPLTRQPIHLSDFKEGDIVVMRGGSPISASIARITKDQAQFSHTAIISRGEDGEMYITETLIETGAHNVKLKDWVEKNKDIGRLAVYRHSTPGIGKIAAQHCHKLVAQGQNGGPLPYDFQMDLNSNEKYFCSELIDDCLKATGNPRYRSPQLTDFRPRREGDLLSTMRIPQNVETTMNPAAFDTTPGLNRVREYTNPKQGLSLFMDDLVFDEILNWLDRNNVQFPSADTVDGIVGGLGNGNDRADSDLPQRAERIMKAVESVKSKLMMRLQTNLGYQPGVSSCQQMPSNIEVTIAVRQVLDNSAEALSEVLLAAQVDEEPPADDIPTPPGLDSEGVF